MPALASLAVLAAAVLAAARAPSSAPGVPFDHVVLVSVDGLRPDAIDGPEDGELPAFRRLQRGPHTLQARSDPTYTITLPNHVGMVTGRILAGPDGHGWKLNDDPPAVRDGGTIQASRGHYVASMFDVAHDRGVRTQVVVTKTKFTLFVQSWDETSGAPDQVEPDQGRAKIDAFTFVRNAGDAAAVAAQMLRGSTGRTLTFLHLGNPDFVGHAEGWVMTPGSAYRKAVAECDAAIGMLFQAIDAEPRLRGHVAIVLTADHGGGKPLRSHVEHRQPEDYLVPFLVWLGADREPQELLALNADRRLIVPAGEYVPAERTPAPIRNAEAGNTALQLMGLPPIPGSTANAKQDLRLAPEASK
jgi:hypothetical protein